MKKTILMLTAATALIFIVCEQETNSEAALENEQQHQEFMDSIFNDNQMMMQIMNTV